MTDNPGPSKLVHWDMDSPSSLPGTSISFLSSQDYEPTSTLQYLNSQLVAHGFARAPGLSLDGLANQDSERTVKCVLSMLGQRVEDLARTEELSSKLRTLNYEHERLQSMHRTAVDGGVNAEREMHLFKSKLAASQKCLASEVSSHKQTLSELQRTRTSLQYLRSTTQNELKRKEKEVERVLDRWNKVSDAQIKLTGAQSGLRCANFAVENEEYVRGKGLMEEALEQAEEARGELVKENDAFRTVLLGIANALQGIVHNVRSLSAEANVEEPTKLSHPALFAPATSSLSQPENAHAKLRELISNFREAFSTVTSPSTPSPATSTEAPNIEELNKLKELVASLRTELDHSRQSAAAQSQAILDRFATHAAERLVSGRDPTPEEAAEMSMELMGAPERDVVREKLEARAKVLEKEREKFTEAAVKLGREKAALEAERVRMLEEKRRWAVEQMLAELPPTPGPDPDLISPRKSRPKAHSPSPPRVRPHKARGPRSTLGSPPKKSNVLKWAPAAEKLEAHVGGKRLRARRESIMFEALEVFNDPETVQAGPNAHQINGDHGLQRSTTPEDSPPVAASTTVAMEMKTSLPLVLPTTFTLPPPSPGSSFAALDLGSIPAHPPTTHQTSSSAPSFDAIPLAAAPPPVVSSLPRSRTFPSPRTPRTLLNQHMKHAYSPARPSPLSRILMLADSPPSPHSVPIIPEEDENDSDSEVRRPLPGTGAPPKRNLARDLAYATPIDEPSPLRERTGANTNGNAGDSGRDVLNGDKEKRFTTKEKGKARAVPAVQGPTAAEKENIVSRAGKPKSTVSASETVSLKPKSSKGGVGSESRPPLGAGKPVLKPPPLKSGSSLKTATSSAPEKSLAGTFHSGAGNVTMARPGGARRVPIGSANAGKLGVRRT